MTLCFLLSTLLGHMLVAPGSYNDMTIDLGCQPKAAQPPLSHHKVHYGEGPVNTGTGWLR